jgi:hypothetical protein
MDPQQTWADMLDALKRKEWDEAKELADALYEWLRKGGFPPTTVGDESLGKTWHKTIAHFTCLAVANKVEEVRQRRERKSTSKGGA